MQEALKNPHYKKIWETINWQIRHPEAESLNLALGSEYLQYPKDCITVQDGIIVKEVLGRPITLEDIILLLPTDSTHFIKNVDGLLQIKVFGIDDVGCDFYIGMFNWQLGKPFHEQTPETWEQIANLIKTL